jgi:hypothetical protein
LIGKYELVNIQKIDLGLILKEYQNALEGQVRPENLFEKLCEEIQVLFLGDENFLKMSRNFVDSQFTRILTSETHAAPHQPLQKLKLDFNENSYNLVCNSEQKWCPLTADSISTKFGFQTSLSSQTRQANPLTLQEAQTQNPDLTHSQAADDDDDESQNLVLYWHFAEGDGISISDTLTEDTDAKTNAHGLIEGKLDTFTWHEIKNIPMERIDKWGKDSGTQYFISFLEGNNNYLKTKEKSIWYPHKFRNLTIELWIRPFEDKGVLWATRNLEIMIGFRGRT